MLQAQIFIDQDEMLGDITLQEFIIQFLLTQKVKGLTIFKGISVASPLLGQKLHSTL